MQQISILTLTVTAAAAFDAGLAVGYDGNIAAAAGVMKGIARADAVEGDAAPVDVLGTSVVTAGGAFSAGDALEVGAGGKLVAQSAGVTVARALQDAAGDGQQVEAILLPS